MNKPGVFKRLSNKTATIGTVDLAFVAILAIIILFGVFMVYEASLAYAEVVFKDRFHFVKLQIGWSIIGIIGMYIISKIDVSILRKYAPLIFFTACGFLLFVLLPTPFAPAVYGARRWIVLNPEPFPAIPGLGRLSFQPSEFAKLASVIFFASLLSSEKIKEMQFRKIALVFTGYLGLVCGLIFLEPNFSTAFIVGTIIVGIYFLSNASMWYFLIATPLMAITAGAYAFSSAYRRSRIQTLLNPEDVDSSGAGYHIHQIMIALGSGGFWGLGMGKSRQKYAYLPEVTADSIFAIIGEEFGFIGTCFLITSFGFLLWRGILIAKKAPDMFSSLLVSGVILWISIQLLINLCAMVRIMPLTGIPLPLISYGGSSTIFMLWALGLILNVSRRTKTSNE
jgi:cell division protein FtsW